MQNIASLTENLSEYLEPEQIQQVRRAYFYAEQAHDGQLRRSGEPYVTHPLAVASILSEMHMDHQSLMAAMLHDVIEDTGIEKQALIEQFGETVADLVDGVSKLTQITFETRAEQQAENFQKMALAMAKDIRVILVKLADRLHNMRTLGVLRPEKKRRIAKETLEIYAPIANRLGMNEFRLEFEELGFQALHPMRSTRVKAAVDATRGNRSELIAKTRVTIAERLEELGHRAEVIGREKHLYGIYQKMRAKHKSFSEIMDVFAFRVIVDDVDRCYRALGVIHSLYKPVPEQFKDYIAIPKSNGYQSLHTVLFGPHGIPIEVQIRTRDMEEMANNGIAAHWLYKTDEDAPLSVSHAQARKWVQGLLEIQQTAGNPLEFIENVKIDLFPDEVYVFTPKGKIMELPKGATALDFAYAVHTDIGNSCVAARLNKRLSSLSEPLQNGQTVEIITSPSAQPAPTWLSFVTTGKARSTIRHFLKTKRHAQSISLGRKLLEKALNNLGTSLDDLTAQQIEPLLAQSGHSNFDMMLEDIGLGNRVAFLTAQTLIQNMGSDGSINRSIEPVVISGTEGLIISYSRCCSPIPGDSIVGHISAGRGIVVHRDRCTNIDEIRHNPNKCIPLNWASEVQGEFMAELRLQLENRRGMLALLATRINALEANIDKITTGESDAQFTTMRISVTVRDRIHLARVIKHIRAIKGTVKVNRVQH
ncbi:guanosine-3',5'-bis(diphosphate) 3'-pyrophosphohydrolase [Sinobacterium caligoides]|uniref:guanosine-3',5'-bis(diphosphate) 3'-diphosphatase n=1 Tax=Sinobacterium caligoides TaxID=933926 RepID=A0A3N2DH80_9GAMM|nr:bifunctional GTP diphosphokinase/guanosine-3',5'-bis pyrophosphate 3'-pyrophosphohydrolase [Sinobacterium caligoides]ROR99091.1 guanosine-3',5'-bis(diphosphate) 3'-pyrophosphohydrolase [Sinobacterium caligoides]